MQDLQKYLSSAPVLSLVWMLILAGILIEFCYLVPDALIFPS